MPVMGEGMPSVFSSNGYVEYQPGDLNIILSVPHGGCLKPVTIPDRDAGSWMDGRVVYSHSCLSKDFKNLAVRQIGDMYTVELALTLANELENLYGKRPHVVISQLHRSKMDANCDREKAAFGVPEAVEAWEAFHEFIVAAKETVTGKGLFLDIHGHAHETALVELGYTVPSAQLNSSTISACDTSVRSLAEVRAESVHTLLTGPTSLGALLEAEGYNCVPSPTCTGPGNSHYYSGGYNTDRHGSKHGGLIDSVQLECPAYVRTKEASPLFAAALAQALFKFCSIHSITSNSHDNGNK